MTARPEPPRARVLCRGTLLDVLTYAREHGQLNEGDTVRVHRDDETFAVTVGKVITPTVAPTMFQIQLTRAQP